MNRRRIKYGLFVIPSVILVFSVLFWSVSCEKTSDYSPPKKSIVDPEKIYILTDDTPNCNMTISDETFKYLSDHDEYSYILDMMSDYFNVIINEEIDPDTVYIKAVDEKINAEVRLAEVYDPSNRVSLLIQIAEAGTTVFNEYNIDEKVETEKKNPAPENELQKRLKKSLEIVADRGSIYSVKAIKDEFKEKTRQIYHSSEKTVSPNNKSSLKYNDYYIDVSDENGITIVCGSQETVISALDYFLTEYIEMGTSADGSYSIDVPDTKVHVGHYLNDTIAGKSVSEYSILYYYDSTYYDSRENAKYLQEYLIKNYGTNIALIYADGSDKEKNKSIGSKIVVGKCLTDISEAYYQQNPDVLDYQIVTNGNDLYILGGSDWAIKYAIDYLINQFLSQEKPVPGGYSMSGNFYGEKIFQNYDDSNLRIMSSNVWNNYNNNTWLELGENSVDRFRYINMAKVYLAYSPDIISFQELIPTSHFSGAMLKEINNGGEKYAFVDGYMQSNWVDRNHTPIIYNTETLNLLESGAHVFSYGSNNNSKSYTWGLFEVKETHFKFIAFSTHLWWKREKAYAGSTQWRIDQMTEICEKANSLMKEYGCPCFVMGDFNCKTSSTEFATMGQYGFSDCHDIATEFVSNSTGRYVCNNNSYSFKPNAGTYKKNGIDHILVKNLKKARVLAYNYALPNFYGKLSDHAPVYIDVRTRTTESE